MGFTGTVGHFMLILAYQRAPASTLTPYLYAQIAFAMLCGWVMFSQVPDRGVADRHGHDRGLRRGRRLAHGARGAAFRIEPCANAACIASHGSVLRSPSREPQQRLLKQAVALLARGEIVAVPTDSSYALACHLDDKDAVDQLRRIRQVDDKHHLTLLCRDLSELASYARVDNKQYRLLKAATPGPYTFLLEATRKCRAGQPSVRRKTIGLRCPTTRCCELPGAARRAAAGDHLIPPGETEAHERRRADPRALREADRRRDRCRRLPIGSRPRWCDLTPMGTGGEPVLVRQGRGPLATRFGNSAGRRGGRRLETILRWISPT